MYFVYNCVRRRILTAGILSKNHVIHLKGWGRLDEWQRPKLCNTYDWGSRLDGGLVMKVVDSGSFYIRCYICELSFDASSVSASAVRVTNKRAEYQDSQYNRISAGR